MSGWTWAWLVWLAAFLIIEGAALIDKDRGDTLSEHIWKWFNIKTRRWHWRRWVLAVFLVWLLVHMLGGF